MPISGESIGNPPWCAEDISVEWLNEVLGKHDDFRGAKISSFEMDMISEGHGFAGEVWRIRLSVEGRTSSTPESIAAKFANRDPQLKSFLSEITVKEANLYRNLATDSEFIMPRCYLSDSDSETGDCAILMEDLSRGRRGDNIGGLSERDAESVVKAIAAFHAIWWERTDQEKTRWLPTLIDQATRFEERYAPSAPRFLEMFSEQVDDEFKEVVTLLFGEKLIPSFEAASSPPLTIRHGDFRPDNFIFDTEFRGPPVTVFDWQLTVRGKGVTDISYMATFGLDVDLRRSIEESLLRLYHTTLVSEGVTGYSLDECQADYRQGFLTAVRVVVISGANLDFSSERGQTLINTLISRTSAVVRDHDLVGLLRGM